MTTTPSPAAINIRIDELSEQFARHLTEPQIARFYQLLDTPAAALAHLEQCVVSLGSRPIDYVAVLNSSTRSINPKAACIDCGGVLDARYQRCRPCAFALRRTPACVACGAPPKARCARCAACEGERVREYQRLYAQRRRNA